VHSLYEKSVPFMLYVEFSLVVLLKSNRVMFETAVTIPFRENSGGL